MTKTDVLSEKTREQADLIDFMEKSVDAELLEAIECAYDESNRPLEMPSIVISYEGTVYA